MKSSTAYYPICTESFPSCGCFFLYIFLFFRGLKCGREISRFRGDWMTEAREEQRPAPVPQAGRAIRKEWEKTGENTRLSRFAEAHQGGNMHPNMYDLNSVVIITFHGLINNQIIEVSGCFFRNGRKKGPPAFKPTVLHFLQSRYSLREH